MNTIRRFGWWLFAAVLVGYCFWSPLTTEFGVHNDYSVWAYDKSNVIFGHPESGHLAAVGRPLGAVLLNLQLQPIDRIADFTAARWVTLLVIVLSTLLVARHLRRLQLPTGVAVCAAACVAILPSSQAYLFWVGNFVPGSLNVLLALLTYEVLDKARLSGWHGGWWGRAKVILWMLLAAFLFLTSTCIYPATTLFMLVPTFCCVIFSPLEAWLQTRRVVLRDALFAIAGMGAYFLLTRFLIRPMMGQSIPAVQNGINWSQSGLYQLSVERNALVWLKNLGNILIVALDGCLHPFLSKSAAPIIACVPLAGLLCSAAWWLFRQRAIPDEILRPARRGYFLQACLTALALVALAELPVIVPAGTSGFVPYRVVYPASAMVALLVFSMAARVRLPVAANVSLLLARPLPALLLVACAILGNLNLRAASANAHNELTCAREQLRGHDLRAIKGVVVIGLPDKANFVHRQMRSEFNVCATKSPFVPGFVNALLAEQGIHAADLRVEHKCFDPSAEYSMDRPRTAMIDMNLAVSGAPARSLQQRRAVVTASGEGKVVGTTLCAFDHDPRSFWEAAALPHWLKVEYGQPYRLAGYSLCADLPADRTPMDWQVLGSNDGQQWTVVDLRQGESGWERLEVRTYPLTRPVEFCTYKIVFTANPGNLVRVSEWCLLHEAPLQVASQVLDLPK